MGSDAFKLGDWLVCTAPLGCGLDGALLWQFDRYHADPGLLYLVGKDKPRPIQYFRVALGQEMGAWYAGSVKGEREATAAAVAEASRQVAASDSLYRKTATERDELRREVFALRAAMEGQASYPPAVPTNHPLPVLIQRLRGVCTVPVDDGAGLLNGRDTFTRSFWTSPLMQQAANELEKLVKEVGHAGDATG